MFDSARQKLKRAKHHIGGLGAAMAVFHDEHRPYKIELDANAGIVTAQFVEPDILVALGLIVGDAVHNLRVALDHAYWELLGIDGGDRKRAAIPTARTQ